MRSAADQVFASLGAELSSAPFGEDLALAGWRSDGLTPASLRG
jgi:hypothetical protein